MEDGAIAEAAGIGIGLASRMRTIRELSALSRDHALSYEP